MNYHETYLEQRQTRSRTQYVREEVSIDQQQNIIHCSDVAPSKFTKNQFSESLTLFSGKYYPKLV